MSEHGLDSSCCPVELYYCVDRTCDYHRTTYIHTGWGACDDIIPNFCISGIVTVFSGLAVTIWAASCIQSKNGALVLILLSLIMLVVGGGLIPPLFGVVVGIIGARVTRKI